MNTILIVFAIIEALVLVAGVALSFLPEMASLIGCAVLVYGTTFTALAFLITILIHDHVHVALR